MEEIVFVVDNMACIDASSVVVVVAVVVASS